MAGKEAELGPTGHTVAENIRRLRGHVSYAELSRWLSDHRRPIPPLGLRRIEAGERRVDVDDLMAFASVFGVNANAILLPHEDGEREYLPTGAKTPQPLARVWDWADGRVPYWRDDAQGVALFGVDARPPGRGSPAARVLPSAEVDRTIIALLEAVGFSSADYRTEKPRSGGHGDG